MKDELDKLRALHEAATPGKWIAAKYSSVLGSGIVASPTGRMIGSIAAHDEGAHNAVLIAAMHANWLDLIAQAERANALEAENARLRGRLQGAESTIHTFERVLGFTVDGPCPICGGIEGCSDTLPGRIRHALKQAGADHG